MSKATPTGQHCSDFSNIAILFLAGIACGCDPASESPYAAGKQRAFVVHMDPADNGSAAVKKDQAGVTTADSSRRLAFKVTGVAPNPAENGSAEAKIAASQAAILRAFADALVQARQARGQSTSNFTDMLGPQMNVTRNATDGIEVIRINLTFNGIPNQLVVRDGVLQHPPVDIRLIRQIFAETNGEFVLLATAESADEMHSTATVACYLPPAFDPAVAMNAGRIESDDP